MPEDFDDGALSKIIRDACRRVMVAADREEERGAREHLTVMSNVVIEAFGDRPGDRSFTKLTPFHIISLRGQMQRKNGFLRSALALCRFAHRSVAFEQGIADSALIVMQAIGRPQVYRYHCLPRDEIVEHISELSEITRDAMEWAKEGLYGEGDAAFFDYERKYRLT